MADLARRGFVTAILQYRESDLAAFPAQIQDAKTGVRFLRKHAEEYHIDVDNIFIMGDSSGGHTAVLAGITAGQDILDTEDYNEFSCEVKAIVDFLRCDRRSSERGLPYHFKSGRARQPRRKINRWQ